MFDTSRRLHALEARTAWEFDQFRRLLAGLPTGAPAVPATDSAQVGELADLVDAVADLRAEVAAQRVMLQSLPVASPSDPGATDLAVRALIRVDDQLGAIVRAGADTTGIVVGQRENLWQAIAELGVVPFEPASGSLFDGRRCRSDSTAVTTDDPALHERVALVVEPGWEWADDGGIVRPARVRLHAFATPDPPAGT